MKQCTYITVNIDVPIIIAHRVQDVVHARLAAGIVRFTRRRWLGVAQAWTDQPRVFKCFSSGRRTLRLDRDKRDAKLFTPWYALDDEKQRVRIVISARSTLLCTRILYASGPMQCALTVSHSTHNRSAAKIRENE